MKKVIATFAIVGLLTACGDGKDDSDSGADTKMDSVASVPYNNSLGDSTDLNGHMGDSIPASTGAGAGPGQRADGKASSAADGKNADANKK